MSKPILPAVAALSALTISAFAASVNWNITEEGLSGVKGGQGTWSVNTDGENKILRSSQTKPHMVYTFTHEVQEDIRRAQLASRCEGATADSRSQASNGG